MINNELPSVLYLEEQDLRLLLDENWSYFKQHKDMICVIGYEFNVRHGKNMGNIMAGILRIKEDKIETVLPFSSKLLYASFTEENGVSLSYVDEGALNHKVIYFNEEGSLNFNDYAFLLNETDSKRLKPNQRELLKAT